MHRPKNKVPQKPVAGGKNELAFKIVFHSADAITIYRLSAILFEALFYKRQTIVFFDESKF